MPSPHAIDALLPQTQCTQCGFSGCMPYAEAIAAGEAPINRCAPGGDDGIHRLAVLTARAYQPLDPEHGAHKPRVLAVVDETRCIGCTICIQKCPVDAIAGAAKLMHTVIADECTGCELCVAPCPVDCIELVPMPMTHPALRDRDAAANHARNRHRARLARQAQQSAASEARKARLSSTTGDPLPVDHSSNIPGPGGVTSPTEASALPSVAPAGANPTLGTDAHKRASIAAALARARARRVDASPG